MMNQSMMKWIAIGAAALVVLPCLCLLVLYPFLPAGVLEILEILSKHYDFILLALVGGVCMIGIAVNAAFRHILTPLNQLAEEVNLIGIVNARHRLSSEGRGIFSGLVRSINAVAVRFEAMQQYDQERINRIREEAEKESRMLASVISELPEGVLICNAKGQILLYNTRVKGYFNRKSENQERENDSAPAMPGQFLGLGRWLTDFLDGNIIQHAINEIKYRLHNGEKNAVSAFVAVSTNRELLRVEMVPILDLENGLTGFMLFFRDITRHMQLADQTAYFFKSLVREIRSSTAGIRATIEAILAYPDMERAQLKRFREIIHEESIMLGAIMDKITEGGENRAGTEWPLARMNAANLFGIVQTKAREKLDTGLNVEICDPELYIKTDAYPLMVAFICLLGKIKQETGLTEFQVKVHQEGDFVYCDVTWSEKSVKVDMLRKWETQKVAVNEDVLPFTIGEVIGHHGGELCVFSDPGSRSNSCIRIFLPVCRSFSEEQAREFSVMQSSRPEYFDFNLFRDENLGLDCMDQLLVNLSYTVFDTETTGLNPSGGDEIISIGAIRIVNGRLLKEETFEQLVDPDRAIPEPSIRIHHILPQTLEGKPKINFVLPQFKGFVADTVLVAHNAAFDMRMLQIKESDTGVIFHNPVLDTLLLSAVIHPFQAAHSLEAISKRMGVSLQGRHTAIGDAMITGRLFLKMIPLLNAIGIFTLREALEASRKTYYARIKY